MINNLPDISKAFGEEKTNEQILDSLQKYRKELNFLLMNLDENNMPAIAGRLDGLDGSFSLIDQQLDSITLAVGNAQGDISALSITVNGISTTVSNHTGQISTINQTVSGIQTTVSSHNTTIGTHTSQITQLGNNISSIVSFTDVTGNQIASKINQTATTISLSASKIDLTGITKLYGSYSGDYVQVNNGRIDFYADGDNALRISTSAAGGTIYSPSGPAVVILDPLVVSDDIYTDYDMYVSDDLDVGGRLDVDGIARFYDDVYINGDDVVTASDPVFINCTSYGIDIRRGRDSITMPWD